MRHIRQVRPRHVQAGTASCQYQPVREEHPAVRPPIPRQTYLGPSTVVGAVDRRRGGPVCEPEQPVPLPSQSASPQDRLDEFPTTSKNKEVQFLTDAKWWFENADEVETRWQEFKLGL